MNFVTNHAARPVDQQSSVLPLCYGCTPRRLVKSVFCHCFQRFYNFLQWILNKTRLFGSQSKSNRARYKWNGWCCRPRFCTCTYTGPGTAWANEVKLLWITPLVQYRALPLFNNVSMVQSFLCLSAHLSYQYLKVREDYTEPKYYIRFLPLHWVADNEYCKAHKHYSTSYCGPGYYLCILLLVSVILCNSTIQVL